MANPKEPFISKGDRPDVKIDPDKPLSNLTVRDLHSILGGSEIYKFRKDKDLEKFSSWKEYWKEYAYEKSPYTETFATHPSDPGQTGIAVLAEHIGGLHKKIDELANQIAELKKSR